MRIILNVSATDRECLAAIAYLNRQHGQGNYTQQQLADYLECSRATVIEIVDRLKNAGILQTEHLGGRHRLRYTVHTIHLADKWKEIYPILWESADYPTKVYPP
jgi:DNA-binding Lrp family transcriptional regulator